MAANSLARRFVKRILYSLANERSYRVFQSLAMAWDIRTGAWKEPELDLIPLAIRRGDTVLDLGANYGMYSYHMSRAVGGSAGRVYAFEPVPFTFSALRLVAQALRFRGVELIDKGCSDKAGTVSFRLGVQESGAIAAGVTTMSARNDERPGKEAQVRIKDSREVTAEVVALDQFLPALSSLTFIKCDIEGAELLAFRGAQRLIEQHHPTVLCEINPWYLEGFGMRVDNLTDFFFERGYALYRYDDKASPRKLRPVAAGDVTEDNYVFVHPRWRDRLQPVLA